MGTNSLTSSPSLWLRPWLPQESAWACSVGWVAWGWAWGVQVLGVVAISYERVKAMNRPLRGVLHPRTAVFLAGTYLPFFLPFPPCISLRTSSCPLTYVSLSLHLLSSPRRLPETVANATLRSLSLDWLICQYTNCSPLCPLPYLYS